MSSLKQAFRATIDASLTDLESLEALLREEQSALNGTDAAALEAVVARKLEALTSLEHSLVAREQVLLQADCGSGLDGSEAFIRRHFTPQEILADWKRLKALSIIIDQLNTHNAKLAFAGERTTRQALSILTGRTEEKTTYSRKRKSGDATSGFSLGKC